MSLDFGGSAVTGTVGERSGGGTSATFAVNRNVTSSVTMGLSVSVATDSRMRVAGYYGDSIFGTVPQDGSDVSETADESIVATFPPAPKVTKQAATGHRASRSSTTSARGARPPTGWNA